MKITTWPSLALAALLTAGSFPQASAGLFNDRFEALVIAERAKDAPSDSKGPFSYAAFDGGYIEAGDPLAGDSPPTADQVRQELGAALDAQGYQSATGTPSLVITYYWGVLRIDSTQIRVPYGIKTNLRARIALVSTEMLGAEVDNHILGREKGSSVDMNAASPQLLAGPLETIVQDSRQPRIFVVVSAYDYQALAQQHEAKLVWRVKLSAQETSGEMDEVIPALIAAGGPFFGKVLPDLHIVTTSLSKAATVAGAPIVQPTPESINLDGPFFKGLLKRERSKVSGSDD